MKEEYKEKLEEKVKIIENYGNEINKYKEERSQILNVNEKLNGKLEATRKELNALNKKYEEFKKKHKENEEIINKYQNEINEYKEKINQILLENKNLNEQIRNFSSNVNDVDLMKFQQKADENKSREILNIFSDKTPGQPLTDTGIFYLLFQFLEDKEKKSIIFKHYTKESEFKGRGIFENISNHKNSNEEIFLGNNNKINLINTPVKNKYNYKQTVLIQNKVNTENNLNKTNKMQTKMNAIFKKDISNNSSLISEKTEEDKEVIKIRNNEFYLKANSDFP